MASELATRIRSKLASRRRRHSESPSLASGHSDGSLLYTLTTPKKNPQLNHSPSSGGQHHHDHHPKQPRRGLSFLKPIRQQSRSSTTASPSPSQDHALDLDHQSDDNDGDDEASRASARRVTRAEMGADGANDKDNAATNTRHNRATAAGAASDAAAAAAAEPQVQEASAGAATSSNSSASSSSSSNSNSDSLGSHSGQALQARQASGQQRQDRRHPEHQPAVIAFSHQKLDAELQPPAPSSPITSSDPSSSSSSSPPPTPSVPQAPAKTLTTHLEPQRELQPQPQPPSQQASHLQSIDEAASPPASPTAQTLGQGPKTTETDTAETRRSGSLQRQSSAIGTPDSTARDPEAPSRSHSQRRNSGPDGALPIPPSPSQTPNFSHNQAAAALLHQPGPGTPGSLSSARPQLPQRRQSLLSNRHSSLIKTLLHSPLPNDANDAGSDLHSLPDTDIVPDMVTRKIWVRRPQASATLITVNEDDLVDDVRDMILRKYANSLGRSFDSPDLIIRIHPREQQQRDRALGPEEPICRTLDAYFPGGQTVDEALVIDVPLASSYVAASLSSARRTPKASPRPPAAVFVTDDGRPAENAEGYFPPVGGLPSPNHSVALQAPTNGPVSHSISVLGTGQLPQIPSPGGSRSRQHQQLLHQHRERSDRPRVGRTHTSSPTVIAGAGSNSTGAAPGAAAAASASSPMASSATVAANHSTQHRPSHSRAQSTASDHQVQPMPQQGGPPPLTTSPGIDTSRARGGTPPPGPRVTSPRVSSPRPPNSRIKRSKRGTSEYPTLPPGLLNGGVPPINVLIVEDNPINLKLLEAFVKRLKVRWQTAMNGRDAVTKWRTGGFHLVLMDIQLPVMNGLDATREIRRLERVNSIGVFTSSPSSVPDQADGGDLDNSDRLVNIALFKSPVIIVALTASSLQSDRHEALAAGCNDFLTKPVNFVWLERKVMEWGCMQALIDFDGWRKWKDFSQAEQKALEAAKKAAPAKPKTKKKSSLSTATSSTAQPA